MIENFEYICPFLFALFVEILIWSLSVCLIFVLFFSVSISCSLSVINTDIIITIMQNFWHSFKPLFSIALQKFGGLQTPFPGGMTSGYTTPSADLDLIKIGEARKSLVGVKLDQVQWTVYLPNYIIPYWYCILMFNPFNPKLIMQILPTIQEENDWVM